MRRTDRCSHYVEDSPFRFLGLTFSAFYSLRRGRRTGGEFLDRTAIHNAPELISDSGFGGLAVGARHGPYCIEASPGEGEMGEVFRAVDTRLDRAVPIKIMRQQFSARFEREARAIAALNQVKITLRDSGPPIWRRVPIMRRPASTLLEGERERCPFLPHPLSPIHLCCSSL